MELARVFTPAQAALLADLRERDASERRAGIRTASSLKALAPSVAELLLVVALARGARTLVEFGTSHGYSTIHLAAAAARNDGHVHTVDWLPEKTAIATANLEAAGLRDRVTLSTCDGADFAAALPGGIDFVLVDYPAHAFEPAFPALRERTVAGCFLFADGGSDDYWESGGGQGLRSILEDDPDFGVAIVSMQRRQLVAVRLAA